MKHTFKLLASLILALGIFASPASAADLALSTNGKTEFRIVKPANPSAVDDYAIARLADYLKQITGAEFPVVDAPKVGERDHCLFVGINPLVIKRLGSDPVETLKDQEHVSRSKGGDLFLYGQGLHGNLHAVMDFLEHSLGWRWYSIFEKPAIPTKPSVTLGDFNRKRGFAFASRELTLYGSQDFYFQNGMNMSSERWGRDPASPFVPYLRNDKFVHSLFAYIPPSPDTGEFRRDFTWLPRTDYFKAAPEFFSLGLNGQRVANMQLCFGNPALRRELTDNVLRHIAAVPNNRIITVDANDVPGKFCHCPDCLAMEKKYQSQGGPMFDYILELCAQLKTKHPGVFVKTLAYRRSQTQKPPALPGGGKLPDNLIVAFAPIEDSYFADWTHPDARNQETYADLKAWNAITAPGNLWAWLYPNPFGTGIEMPVGNLERNINQLRLMHKAGVRGLFTDHNEYLQRGGLSELQVFLFFKLFRDIDCDTDAAIKEFTDHQYGAAAPLVRKYLTALEQGRKEMRELPPGTFHSDNLDDRTFPYLTVENIHRWQTWFDQMEQQVADAPERLLNLRLLRRELDFATLWKWFELKKTHPDYFRDHLPYAARITAVNNVKAPEGTQPPAPMGAGTLEDMLAMIAGGGQVKSLPKQFDDIDPARIKQFLPRNYGYGSQPKILPDQDAAFGYAATVDLPDLPFEVGFYQWLSRNPEPGQPSGVDVVRLKLNKDQITPGEYRLYELGEIVVTSDSWIWFSAKSWVTRLEVGTRIYEPGAANTWHAWVSLKLNGPSYGGKAKDDQVLCDRIILVKKL